MNSRNFHEDYSPTHKVKIGSDRKFGIVIFIVFLIIALPPLINHHSPRWWSLFISLIFLTISLMSPEKLHSIHLAWIKLGEFLRMKIATPIIIGILFFLVFTPIAILLKIFGKDLLNIRKNTLTSYWKDVTQSNNFSDQF